MSGSNISSFASNTSLSAYCTVQITFPPILKSPNTSRPSSIRYLVYKLNTIGDKLHPSLTPLPVFTLLVYPRSSSTLTLCSMYNLLIFLRVSRYKCSFRSTFIRSSLKDKCLLPVYEASTQFFIYAQILFSYYSQKFQLHSQFPFSLLNPNVSLLNRHLLDSFYHFTVQDVRTFLISICFLVGFDFQFFRSISSNEELLPNYRHLSPIVSLKVFDANGLNPLIFFLT